MVLSTVKHTRFTYFPLPSCIRNQYSAETSDGDFQLFDCRSNNWRSVCANLRKAVPSIPKFCWMTSYRRQTASISEHFQFPYLSLGRLIWLSNFRDRPRRYQNTFGFRTFWSPDFFENRTKPIFVLLLNNHQKRKEENLKSVRRKYPHFQ